jgi:hypothetical protein
VGSLTSDDAINVPPRSPAPGGMQREFLWIRFPQCGGPASLVRGQPSKPGGFAVAQEPLAEGDLRSDDLRRASASAGQWKATFACRVRVRRRRHACRRGAAADLIELPLPGLLFQHLARPGIAGTGSAVIVCSKRRRFSSSTVWGGPGDRSSRNASPASAGSGPMQQSMAENRMERSVACMAGGLGRDHSDGCPQLSATTVSAR